MSGPTIFGSDGKELFTDDNPAKVSLSGSVSLSSNSGVNVAVSSRGSDYDSNGSNNLLYTSNYQQAFNGSSWDRWRNNTDGVLLASASRTATNNTGTQTNHNAKGIMLIFDITSITTGIVQPYIYGVDPASGTAYALHTGINQFTSVGKHVLVLYPTAGVTGGHVKSFINGILPRKFYISVVHGESSPVTYSMSYSLIL